MYLVGVVVDGSEGCAFIAHHVPQSSVAGHSFGSGSVSGSQLEVLQVTAPGVPDKPAPTPHLLAHPVGSPHTQSPGMRWVWTWSADVVDMDVVVVGPRRTPKNATYMPPK